MGMFPDLRPIAVLERINSFGLLAQTLFAP